MFSGGAIGAKGQRRVVELMDRDGMAEDWLKEIKWGETGAFSSEEGLFDRITEAFSRFFETKTKAELLEEAIDGGIMMAPVNTVAELYEDPQLEARDFWIDVERPDQKSAMKFPGAPVKMSETPWEIHGRAPFIGEHNTDFYMQELHFTQEELKRLTSLGVI
jgi:crotonobetainyl-CoA:carnitine CoA-transferase CaiB-like acyl-CoA transferase